MAFLIDGKSRGTEEASAGRLLLYPGGEREGRVVPHVGDCRPIAGWSGGNVAQRWLPYPGSDSHVGTVGSKPTRPLFNRAEPNS
jgi:hypothetical protein